MLIAGQYQRRPTGDRHGRGAPAQGCFPVPVFDRAAQFQRVLSLLPPADRAWLAGYQNIILDTVPAYRPPTRDDLIRQHDRDHNPADWSLRQRAAAIETDLARASTMNRVSSPRLVSAALILAMPGGRPLRSRQLLSIISAR